ncbi:MAG: hypothetical protein GXO88_06010 [Chlorobi bacterium]|nr:hypothetical protein [Chlorobiota bacterium]
MKKSRLLFLALLLSSASFAQVEVAPFVGYMFGGGIDYYEGRFKIYDNMNYGASLIVPVREIVDFELNYTRMDTHAKFTAYRAGWSDVTISNLAVNYIQVGALKALSMNNDMVRPFGNFSMGVGWSSASEPGLDIKDVVRFSITAGLGVKIFFTERVGIILRGRLLMPLNFSGVGFYYGIGGGGSGGGLSLNTYAPMIQGDFNGGLIFRLGN